EPDPTSPHFTRDIPTVRCRRLRQTAAATLDTSAAAEGAREKKESGTRRTYAARRSHGRAAARHGGGGGDARHWLPFQARRRGRVLALGRVPPRRRRQGRAPPSPEVAAPAPRPRPPRVRGPQVPHRLRLLPDPGRGHRLLRPRCALLRAFPLGTPRQFLAPWSLLSYPLRFIEIPNSLLTSCWCWALERSVPVPQGGDSAPLPQGQPARLSVGESSCSSNFVEAVC
ncbi:Auxin-independent growth promoter-like protein, mRNA, partial [Zea mays]